MIQSSFTLGMCTLYKLMNIITIHKKTHCFYQLRAGNSIFKGILQEICLPTQINFSIFVSKLRVFNGRIPMELSFYSKFNRKQVELDDTIINMMFCPHLQYICILTSIDHFRSVCLCQNIERRLGQTLYLQIYLLNRHI